MHECDLMLKISKQMTIVICAVVTVDSTDKDTKYIKAQSTGTEGYLEYTKEKEKCKVNQLYVGNKKDQQNSGSNNPRTSKNKNKTK